MRPARLALAVVFVLTACVAVLHAVERWQLTTQLRFEGRKGGVGGGVLFTHVFHFEDISMILVHFFWRCLRVGKTILVGYNRMHQGTKGTRDWRALPILSFFVRLEVLSEEQRVNFRILNSFFNEHEN